VCEAVSVEMGARRPPLPTAVVCLRLAITAVIKSVHFLCLAVRGGRIVRTCAREYNERRRAQALVD
jgi:hypothetical protein